MNSLEAQLDIIESELKKGNFTLVRDFLRKLNRQQVPESQILRVCQIARRSDFPRKSLMLLRDRVIDGIAQKQPDAAEVIEYAASLLKVGAVTECQRLLSSPQCEQVSESKKYMAFTFIHQWNYESAIPYLKSFLKQVDHKSYEHLVCSLNLAASFTETERFDEALEVLKYIIEISATNGHRLILGNAHELCAQNYIHTNQWSLAERSIELSWQSLKNAQPRYRLYLEKWQAIGALKKSPKDPSASAKLNHIRVKALQEKEGEVVRECDLYESIITNNADQYLKVYFGTPHSAYREKAQRQSKGRFLIPPHYIWSDITHSKELDVESGTDGRNKRIFKKDQALHRTVMAITQDFYAPISAPQLFTEIFEEERFHHTSSIHRIQELIRRVKKNLNSSGFNVSISSSVSGYRIHISECDFAIKMSANRFSGNDLFRKISSKYQNEEFKLRELSEFLGVPHTTVYREIVDLVENRKLTVIGKGKNTKYRVMN